MPELQLAYLTGHSLITNLNSILLGSCQSIAIDPLHVFFVICVELFISSLLAPENEVGVLYTVSWCPI